VVQSYQDILVTLFIKLEVIWDSQQINICKARPASCKSNR
jgi:hypothetical protein